MLDFNDLWNSARAVLFDFDGVLADSEPFYRQSWNTALAPLGHAISPEIYWKHWAFMGEGLAGEMKRTGLSVPDPDGLKRIQSSVYESFCLSGRIPLFPMAAEALKTAMVKKRVAIASNTSEKLIRIIVDGDVPELPVIVGGDGLRKKPAPDIFLRAAEILSVPPGECLVFEDAWKGIRAAAAAGMNSVLVNNRYNSSFPGGEASCRISGLAEIVGRGDDNCAR